MAAGVLFLNNELEDDPLAIFSQVFQRLRGFKINDSKKNIYEWMKKLAGFGRHCHL